MNVVCPTWHWQFVWLLFCIVIHFGGFCCVIHILLLATAQVDTTFTTRRESTPPSAQRYAETIHTARLWCFNKRWGFYCAFCSTPHENIECLIIFRRNSEPGIFFFSFICSNMAYQSIRTIYLVWMGILDTPYIIYLMVINTAYSQQQ